MATVSSTIELIDKMSATLETIQGNINGVKDSLKSIEDQQSSIDNFSWATFLSNAEQAGKRMAQIGQGMTLAISAPLALLGKKMYGNAVDYESAFAGVKKTTDATEEEYARLYQDLIRISETNPTGFVNAAGIMEMAGQLGVAKEELTDFTQAYIGLQESTNIQGEAGAADLARFLNVTQKTTANVDRVSGVIVGLGNNFATTEQEILSMATRMGATADLAGFHVAEILAFSAALSSVGINAEAGGSAAGKLMKKMQLAAEVGGTAEQKLMAAGYEKGFWENGMDFSNWLSIQKKEDVAELAWKLNMTTDAVQEMADSWLLLDQFSEVMGMDQAGFLKSWDESAAQSMLKFFQGLGNLDPETGNSVLAQLAEMDLTEIRLSNLVAAMAGNSDLFQAALAEAYRQYTMNPEENAMTVEVQKRYETQESQNAMLGNKLQNTMADFGQNLVDALNPALDIVNQLLEKFNSLSESDQTKLIYTLGAIAILGPSLTVAGKAIEVTSKAIQGFNKFRQWGGLQRGLSSIAEFAISTPAGNVFLLAAGVTALAIALDQMPSDLDRILEGAANIPITIDEAQYQEALEKISTVQAALDGLKPGEVKLEYEQTSLAVGYGIGTNDMYASALAYESEKANAAINQVSSEYAAQIAALEQKMSEAIWRDDRETAMEYRLQIDALKIEADAALSAARQDYSAKISELFNGMASQYPEQAAVLEQAAKQYDVVAAIDNFLTRPTAELAATYEWEAQIKANPKFEQETDFNTWYEDFLNQYQTETAQLRENMASMLSDLGYGDMDNLLNLDYASMMDVYNQVVADLTQGLQTVSDNPILATWLQTLIGNDALTENLDFSNLEGSLAGIVKLLDFKNAVEQAKESGNVSKFGKYLVEGLANGVIDNAALIQAPFTTVRDNALDALRAAFGISSPSTVMQAEGTWIPAGLALGIMDGTGGVAGAMAVVSTAGIAILAAVINRENGEAIAEDFIAGFIHGLTFGRVDVETPALKIDPLAVEIPEIPKFAIQLPKMDAITIEAPEINPVQFVIPDMDAITIQPPTVEPITVDSPEINIDIPNIQPIVFDSPEIMPVTLELPETERIILEAPEINPVSVDVPEMNVNIPEIPPIRIEPPEIPKFAIQLPKMDAITIEAPEIIAKNPEMEPIEMTFPGIEAVTAALPAMNVDLPDLQTIQMEAPELAPLSLKLPEINPIEMTVPAINPVSMNQPEFEDMLITLPDVEFSELNINADFAGFVDEATLAGSEMAAGYGAGIESGLAAIASALSIMGALVNASTMGTAAQAVQTAKGIMNYSAGFGIGNNMAAGMTAGVNSGAGALAAAVAAMVRRALAAGNAAAQIHSPSKLTYWSGEMMVQGYINAIQDGESGLLAAVSDLAGNSAEIWIEPVSPEVQFSIDPITAGMERSLQTAEDAVDNTMGYLVSYAEKAWNEAAWSDIAYFAAMEHDQLLSDAEDSIKISEADIRKIRQLAEREVINQFTTAEIKVQMNNNNTIKSDMDLDGIADYLAEVVTEKLEAAAEGVYK